MVQFILIRPGTTDYDQQARIQGTLDIPLNDQGRREVVAVAEKLKGQTIAALYCSPAQSAQESAEIIGEALELKPRTLEKLQNANQGLWQGLTVEEVRLKQPKVYKQWQERPESISPPQGEMLSEVAQRVKEVLEKLGKKHRDATVAIVAPEPLATVVRHCINGEDLGDLWKAANGANRLETLLVPPERPANASTNGKTAARSNGAGKLMYRGVAVDIP
jgi:phosphoserine phosphatase